MTPTCPAPAAATANQFPAEVEELARDMHSAYFEAMDADESARHMRPPSWQMLPAPVRAARIRAVGQALHPKLVALRQQCRSLDHDLGRLHKMRDELIHEHRQERVRGDAEHPAHRVLDDAGVYRSRVCPDGGHRMLSLLERVQFLATKNSGQAMTAEDRETLRRWVYHIPPFPTSHTARSLVARVLGLDNPGAAPAPAEEVAADA